MTLKFIYYILVTSVSSSLWCNLNTPHKRIKMCVVVYPSTRMIVLQLKIKRNIICNKYTYNRQIFKRKAIKNTNRINFIKYSFYLLKSLSYNNEMKIIDKLMDANDNHICLTWFFIFVRYWRSQSFNLWRWIISTTSYLLSQERQILIKYCSFWAVECGLLSGFVTFSKHMFL